MTKTTSLFAALALLLVGASSAAAQVRVRAPDSLAGATANLAHVAIREAPDHPFARISERLAHRAQRMRHDEHGVAHFDRNYRRARRTLLDPGLRPSDELLDAWDGVVVEWGRVRRRGRPTGPVYGRPARPPHPRDASYVFEGSFERMPVRFVANSLDELERVCRRFTSAVDTNHVDDVEFDGQRLHNGPSFWDDAALCSIAVLNARTGRSPVILEGSIEGVPFAVRGPRAEAERILDTHIPRITRSLRVDDMVIGGRTYRNGPSYWTPAQLLSMIRSQLPGDGYGHDPWGTGPFR